MTGNVTSLDVSRRLARAMKPEAEHGLWWIQMEDGGVWAITEVEACDIHHEYGDVTGCIAAYTLSELEAEIRQMRLECTIVFGMTYPAKALANLRKGGIRQGEGFAKHIIDALGDALAQAKEKT